MEATSAIFRATNNASFTETMIAYSVKKDKLLFLKSLALNLFFEISLIEPDRHSPVLS